MTRRAGVVLLGLRQHQLLPRAGVARRRLGVNSIPAFVCCACLKPRNNDNSLCTRDHKHIYKHRMAVAGTWQVNLNAHSIGKRIAPILWATTAPAFSTRPARASPFSPRRAAVSSQQHPRGRKVQRGGSSALGADCALRFKDRTKGSVHRAPGAREVCSVFWQQGDYWPGRHFTSIMAWEWRSRRNCGGRRGEGLSSGRWRGKPSGC